MVIVQALVEPEKVTNGHNLLVLFPVDNKPFFASIAENFLSVNIVRPFTPKSERDPYPGCGRIEEFVW